MNRPTSEPARPALPPGHIMPPEYETRAGAVFNVIERTDRKGNPIAPQVTRVTYGPLCISRMSASDIGEQWFDLQWQDGHRTVSRRVDGSVVRSGKALVRELGAVGIPVIEADAKPVERYLAAYLVANHTILEETRMTIARHLGWQSDGTFVTGDGAPRPVEPAEPEQRPALGAHRPAGTLPKWQSAVKSVERYPVVRIVLAAAFAAPLLAVLRLDSFTVDISSRSSRGKSTAAGLGLSVWADPSGQGDGMGTWKTSMIMIEKRLNLVRGLPVVLDETRVVKSPEIVDQVLYQVPMNRGTARGGGWSSMLPWHTVLISTGEQPALSFTSHEGAAARVLSLRRPPFGLDGQRSGQDARAVTELSAANYGVAGPAFIAKLQDTLAEPDGAEQLRKRHQQLLDQHAEAARNDVARRRAPLSAALHLAAQLAHEWDIVPLPALELEVWTDHLSDEATREDRGQMALDVVRGLIAAQGHRILPLNKEGATVFETPSAGWIGAHILHEGEAAIAILPEAMAQALNKANPPIVLDAVREAWAEKGTIIMDGKRLLKARIDGSRVRCYVFAQHTLDGEDEIPDNPDDTTATDNAAEPVQEEIGAAGWPKGSYGDLANR